MMSCNCCGNKYHLSCLRTWGQHRDLFHWSSWTCPSCRVCEGCQTTGDPNKFMFCKRCDAAYHCYCMQPPLKKVSSGPYLCPKHTKCHSCCSNVPGNGLRASWYLGYTCCDACGRLFVKGNYCQVCLKVYRDSDTTPMVCCDICERWVHTQCDDISDEKYLQFQVDDLPYSCPTCRGYSYKSINLSNAVQELWKRRDVADRDLIASLRAGAGLPVDDEIFSISPFSEDENNAPLVKNKHKQSLKLSLKGIVDKSPQMSKEYGKDSCKEKGLAGQNEGHPDAPSGGCSTGDVKNDELQAYGEVNSFSSPVGSLTEGNEERVQLRENENSERDDTATKLGGGTGSEDLVQLSENENTERNDTADKLGGGKGHKMNHMDQIKGQNHRGKESNLMKIKKVSPEGTNLPAEVGGKFADGSGPYPPLKTFDILGKRSNDGSVITRARVEAHATRDNKLTSVKHAEAEPASFDDLIDKKNSTPSVSNSARKDPKPLLKLKFKNPCHESPNALASPGEEHKSVVKGQRSKRKRAPAFGEKSSTRADENLSQQYEDNTMDEFLDANWILQKLGKDAKGKRVKIHHSSDNTWHIGTVVEVFEGSPVVSVAFDDGKKENVELGKQGIRFVSLKSKNIDC
ncbi:histone-lysine N-methyltransferase 2D-like isoform X2 [Solanum pennellii]|uniref:Histone-lysine N-methyltransferase 2D-like isoform X2 n=1 Tax=Solanum pennellii TaxID=28526 RepID=A0ABM1FX68_SOLPN|nr:histone-lysine N-methyltransferase 2D-like isoform X2 [Solanum pennellii]